MIQPHIPPRIVSFTMPLPQAGNTMVEPPGTLPSLCQGVAQEPQALLNRMTASAHYIVFLRVLTCCRSHETLSKVS
ncbi:hypothetical protein T10_4957 [Trichinella papuae]|uniref:Uncharacterized protein n=1 Tax=Trichinella papuae TaxID=268474 RepID=A0A0V1N6F4_9BILA|nr:hypothetical protein T10_4957 [Trichinella papuae]